MVYERAELTDPNMIALWDMAISGKRVAFDSTAQDRNIPGDLMAQILRGEGMDGSPRKVIVKGALIAGKLDLEAANLLCPLELTECDFESAPDISQAEAPNITLTRCTFPGLRAWELKTSHDFSLEGSSSSDLIDLSGAEIGGQLDLKDAKFPTSSPTVLKANGLKVHRDMRWSDLRTEGQISMIGAHITGQFICDGARLNNPGRIALLAQGIVVGAHAYFRSGFIAQGQVDLSGSTIEGRLDCRGGQFLRPGIDSGALRADRIHIGEDMICGDGFTANGGVNLTRASIQGSLRCTAGKFLNSGGKALRLEGIKIRQNLECKAGFKAEGQVLLAGSTIDGNLRCQGGHFIHPTGDALEATGMKVGQDAVLGKDNSGEQAPVEGFVAEGGVKLTDAIITENLDCTGGSFSKSQRTAINAQGITARDVLLREDFHADGMVDFSGAQINGEFVCTGGQFSGSRISFLGGGMTVRREAKFDAGFRADGKVHIRRASFHTGLSFDGAFLAATGGSKSLVLRGTVIKGRLNLATGEKPLGRMDLRRASVTELYDERAVWPNQIMLQGFCYEALREGGPGVEERLEWLRRNEKYVPQIYRQLAKVYQATGDEDLARRVLIVEQDVRRKSRPGFHGALARVGGWFLKATVGYGYNPFRVLAELAVLEVVGGTVFSLLRHDIKPISPHSDAEFQPWLYSLDLLLPVINFRWSIWFYPTGSAVWWAAAFTAMGWALATALVIGIGGAIKRR
ncbi:hypothetical protein OHS70_25980 [Streptomyces sp. NBC_00390]|uniref:hypothetical protein n=1 Tax=Streptomyces sp. NBC_00390 TaxID=2975736 RepID=UPI002E1F2195